MSIRRQLTLFPSVADAVGIERIRQMWNPVQAQLIPAHVTLCREDEIGDGVRAFHHLAGALPVVLDFGVPVRFDEGKGVLLPALGENAAFHALRAQALRDQQAPPRRHEPHLTLLHPRNATCTDAIFAHIAASPLPRQLTFSTVCLIAQINGGVWTVLEKYDLC